MTSTTNSSIMECPETLSTPTPSRISVVRRVKNAIGSWNNLLWHLSNLLLEWTPFILTVTYYIASTAVYTSCSEKVISVFYFFYMAVNFYIACCTVIEAFLGMKPLRESRAAAITVQEKGVFPSSDKVLPTMYVRIFWLPSIWSY